MKYFCKELASQGTDCLINLVRDIGQLLRALEIVPGCCPRSCLDILYVD